MNKNDLKSFREKHRLSQAQLAEIVGVKIGTVQSWEQGKRNIGQSAIKLLQKYERKGQSDLPLEDLRVEDLIAQKVIKELKPYMGQLTEEIIKNVVNMDIELTRIKVYLDELHKQQEELADKQNKTYDLIKKH